MIALRALGVAAGLVLLWQAVILLFQPPHFMLPTPLAVFDALMSRSDLWRVHAWATLFASIVGLFAGILVGMALALMMSLLPISRRLLLPVMVVSQAIPVFAIAPILVLWLGFGSASKIVMATIAIFFPVASAYADGLQRTDRGLVDLAQLYGASRWQTVFLLRMPAALPSLVTGIRLAAVYAPVGALIGEWVGSSSGLGTAMLFANSRAQTDVMFAALVLVIAMSVGLRALVDLATARVAPWAPQTEELSERRE
jgi:putative hydroxymethylpyrimidine transport system permease protein